MFIFFSSHQSHLEIMIRALRDYINEQNKENLEMSLSQLKKNLDFDSTAIDHLHLALYSFQDAVISVLRKHSIKPHWMFALDNLVKSAVQAGIMILSPELGLNLAGHERLCNVEEEETESTSGVSTVNSNKTKAVKSTEKKYYMEEIATLRGDNIKLMQDLLEAQRTLQTTLKTLVDDERTNLEIIRNYSKHVTSMSSIFERSISQGYFSDVDPAPPLIKITGDSSGSGSKSSSNQSISDAVDGGGSANRTTNSNSFSEGSRKTVGGLKSCLQQQSQTKTDSMVRSPTPSSVGGGGRRINFSQEDKFIGETTNSYGGVELRDWLVRNAIDANSRALILGEEFTYDDFIHEMTQDEMRRIGLK